MMFVRLGERLIRRYSTYILTVFLCICIYITYNVGNAILNVPTIIVVTPTHYRLERIADMTRLSQTLMHVRNIHWIVIEDANRTVDLVERILQRSRIPYVYFYSNSEPGMPKRGWTHRNMGLKYIRKNYANFGYPGVVYFADDDNTYDQRLFDKYIRNVKTIGIWAVGLVGNALIEAPHVVNETIVSWDVVYNPNRKFATDMAGFAINLDLILRTNASFHKECKKLTAESCFLDQFKIPKSQVQPFGYNDVPKEVLVWHTKTKSSGSKGSKHGYDME
ncbi:hypothetical protein AB6A40_006720 [Gnathostoma spinigerum]|uniref:Galactosylgalactosylxylosylprotein 3-beta-glucuronosyltransferase n=1 Tax=Gnathostoma spinigerum TaxID=75299 RepID=A0ABD6EL73_9BILA